MTGSPLVAIVILNWNGGEDTCACVASCRGLTWPNRRIIIVDNGSDDGSEEQLRKECPDAELIQTGANLGFAGGNNAGIRAALDGGADFVWLLNNDAVAAPDALDALVAALTRHRDAGGAGSKIYYLERPETIWYAGGIWEQGCLRLRQRGAGREDRGEFATEQRVGALPAAACCSGGRRSAGSGSSTRSTSSTGRTPTGAPGRRRREHRSSMSPPPGSGTGYPIPWPSAPGSSTTTTRGTGSTSAAVMTRSRCRASSSLRDSMSSPASSGGTPA